VKAVPEHFPLDDTAVVVVVAADVVALTLAVVVDTLTVEVAKDEVETLVVAVTEDEEGTERAPLLDEDQKPMVDWKPSLFWDWLIRPVPPIESWWVTPRVAML